MVEYENASAEKFNFAGGSMGWVLPRSGYCERKTNETDIQLTLNLDGVGNASVATGVGFFDHMLAQIAKHGGFDLEVQAKGDLHIDDHHTVEDVGLCFGEAMLQAVGEKIGIQRYGFFTLPMDDVLATVAVDFCGRPAFVWHAATPTPKVGTFDCELAAEFWRATASSARINYHAVLHHGQNSHHILEAIFKASGRALRAAIAVDSSTSSVPSTKGRL